MQPAKVISACGMFYDLEDPSAFIYGVAKALHPDGIFIAQLMCLKNMLNIGDIGNFAHEHLEYYSLRALITLYSEFGLEIFDIETNSVNGESYRIFAKHMSSSRTVPGGEQRVAAALAAEEGLDRKETYDVFFAKLEANKKACVDFIKQVKADGKEVWILGASTKGNCIAQFYGLDHTLITAASDRSPEKHGKFMIGSDIPIVTEAAMRVANPAYALILPYAFRDEIMCREQQWYANGGKFLIPLPVFEVV